MFRKNADKPSRPFVVSVFCVLHCLLFGYSAAIVGISFFLTVDHGQNALAGQAFALTVGGPMMLCSLFFGLAATARVFFIPGVFFCALLALVFATLPLMMNIFFPLHLVVFLLSAFYAVSFLVLVRFLFSLPTRKMK